MLGALNPRRGFTIVELLIVMAVAAILVVIAAPNLRDFLRIQRLKSVNAQVITDIQLTRSEAVARGRMARIHFQRNGSLTCYTVYTAPESLTSRCNCLSGAGSACGAGQTEIKTARYLRSDDVVVIPVLSDSDSAAIAFDHVSGGLLVIPEDDDFSTPDSYDIDTAIDDGHKLRVRIARSGRVSACLVAGNINGFDACP